MDNFKVYISDSLEKYDKNKEIYTEMFKDVDGYRYNSINNDMENDQIWLYDKDNKKIFEADFEYIGDFFVSQKIWIWGWALHHLKKKWIRKSKQMLSYGLSLDHDDNSHLKLELINSRFVITDPIQIDIHLAIASEMTKIPCIYQIIRTTDSDKYIVYLTDKDSPGGPDKSQYIIKIPRTENIEGSQLHYFFLYNIKRVG